MSIENNLIALESNPLKILSKDNKITLQQILNNLLDASENLELKSHIFKPKQLAGLKTLAMYFEQCECNDERDIILGFIVDYLKYMVSYKRLSRSEIIKAFTSSRVDDKPTEGFNTNLD